MIADKKIIWKNFIKEGLPFGVFCGSAMITVSLWFGWYTIADSFENFKITKWQAVECEIITSKIQTGEDNVYIVAYEYEWQNDYFKSNRYQYEWDGESSVSGSEAAALAEKYKPGDKAICYVNPNKPNEAVLLQKEPFYLTFTVILGCIAILGARQLCLGIKRFLSGELAEHKNGNLDDVHFETSQPKGIVTKILTYLTGFGLFLTFLLNFPMAILITVFYYLIAANAGEVIQKFKYTLVKIELNSTEDISKSSLSDKEVHFTFFEKIVIQISFVIYLMIMVFIAMHNIDRSPFALFGVFFNALWLCLFMSTIVWMIISMMHGYHYIALQEEKKTGASKFDISIWSLLISNLVIIIWAVLDRWSLYVILWVYWGQSLCIGVSLLLKTFVSKEIVNDLGARVRKRIKVSKVLGFLIIFSIFHLGYIVFLNAFFQNIKLQPKLYMVILPAIGIFLLQQVIVFIYDIKKGRGKVNVDDLIGLAGLRIVPMHLTIMGAGFLSSAAGFSIESPVMVALFLGLKAFADIAMCLYTRKGFSEKMDAAMDDNPNMIPVRNKDTNEDKSVIEKSNCLCDKITFLEGIAAHKYAKGHLKLKQVIDNGRQVEYVCPYTGKNWLMDFTEEKESKQEYYSRLRQIPKQ